MIRPTLLALALMSAPAAAQDWMHTSAPMGQYEGGVRVDDGAYGVSYACGPGYSNVSLFADGVHVVAGESRVLVDGEEIASGNTVYNSARDTTAFTSEVKTNYGDAQKAAYNAVISAIASGQELTWVTPTDAEFVIPLTGSASIRNCVMEE